MPLAIHSKLGPYEILSRIGAGGMGEVYKARDTRLGRIVAIKQLKGGHTARFEQEAQVIASLNHPHICQIHDIGPDYLVLEYIEGEPVRGPLPVDEAVKLALQIAGALEEAHGRGILHRDLKPGNILVTPKGSAKLLDFGLAKLLTGSDSDVTRTTEGAMLGTPAYMSPEQARGNSLDLRSDIFSFGAVLYEMLSGRRAFAGDSAGQVLSAVLSGDPPPLDPPGAIHSIVWRCLAKEPALRFQTMAEVKMALEQLSAEPAHHQPSIAVLPFANMSADKDNEYFGDGLSEEIINELTKVAGLKVTARTSGFSFRGKDVAIGEIGRMLKVEHILEGSVRRAGNRIRVAAQLIKAADGFHVWSERYDRELTDIFAIQDEISAAIASQLKVSLTGARGPKKHTTDMAAYEAFLEGRHHYHRFSRAGIAKCLECLQRALSIDPNYAPIHEGLAAYYWGIAWAGLSDPREVLPKARASARRALALDDSLAGAHALLGTISAAGDYDWAQAGEHFQQALQLDPASPEVSVPHAIWYLRPLGRLEEGLSELEGLRQRDPLSVIARTESAWMLLLMRRYDASAEMAKQALELDPNNCLTMYTLLQARVGQARHEEAILVAQRAVQVDGRWLVSLMYLAIAYAAASQSASARQVLGEMHQLASLVHTNATAFAAVYAALGEIDTAAEWVEKAIDQRAPLITTLKTWPIFDSIRFHPRYATLLQKLNLADPV